MSDESLLTHLPTSGAAGRDGLLLADLDQPQLLALAQAQGDEIRALCEKLAHAETRAALVDDLRAANENLVVEALSAHTGREDAAAANRRQNEFLAMLAHELRNPLAPISMAANLMARIPNAPPALERLREIIGRQSQHLARLLDDLLDAARISSGKISLVVRPVLLSEIVERAAEAVSVRMEERRQHFSIQLPRSPVTLDGDLLRLIQVFSNLLVNAAKFTPDGGVISLVAEVVAGNVVVTVADNGVGIAADVLPHIFALFTQGPRSLERAEGGLGVGLNVVHNILQMHGGEVHARSGGLGYGSKFMVSLPVSRNIIGAGPAEEKVTVVRPTYRILLVEDNLDASDTLRDLLVCEGHSVRTAFDGLVGLEMACANPYDVLICDIGLPGLDGFGLIRALRERAVHNISFAIALSGYGQPEDRARAISAGFGQYFVKPVDIEILLALIGSPAVAKFIALSQRRY